MQNFENFFDYHNKTKHSYFSVRNYPNRLDWNNQPSTFKSYPNQFTKYELDLEKENHNFIYLIAGITAKKSYPGVEYFLRVNPSAGALFPNEVYFQSRGNDDLIDGIYHFDNASSSITLLKKIDENKGLEAYFKNTNRFKGFIFFISSIYYRSSWKYKNRAFRYCLLDAGHLLGAIEASSYIFDKEYKIISDFDKSTLNDIFNFDRREFFNSSIFLGEYENQKVEKITLDIPTIDGAYFFEENELIENAYKDSLKITNIINQDNKANFSFNKSFYQEVIIKRRSIREFTKGSITKTEFESILNVLNEPVSWDCDEKLDIYCVINRVKDMKLGLLKNGEYIKEGDFMQKAGYLCLEQDLGRSSAVTFFITSKAKNYQELYQKAGLIGHRLYLASNYLNIECSGIGAYYDDEVCEFIGENTQVLYALAIGK